MNNIILTAKDIDLLSKDMSAITKSETIKKISKYYKEGQTLSLAERKVAEDIFRIMVSDIEIVVREVLADSLKNSEGIPEDIVRKIISDEDSVSLSFIKEYKSFTEEDLINILNIGNINKQKAVVNREYVSGNVADYVVNKCSKEISKELLDNAGCQIFDNTYDIIVDKYKDNEDIKSSLVIRNSLPPFVANKILDSLSINLQKKLLENKTVSTDVVSNILEKVRDRVSFAIFSGYEGDWEIENLIKELSSLDRLNDRIVVRALCVGNLKFFEHSLSFLSNKKVGEVRKILLFSKDDFIIRNLLRESKIAIAYFPIVLAALKIIKDMEYEDSKLKLYSFSKKILERLLTLENVNGKFEDLDLKYFMSKIG